MNTASAQRFWAVAVFTGCCSVLLAADARKPHPHTGVLTPYTQLPLPQLTEQERAQFQSGKPVYRQAEGKAGGRGMAIFKVAAAPEVVWGVITDFPNYTRWIDNLCKCDVYGRNGNQIDVAFRICGFGLSVDYFIRHDYHAAEHWGTWTLDYSRRSDLDDSVGFWRVTPLAESPGASQVEYSVDVQIRGWIPGFVRGMFVDKGLKQATQWVKTQAEARKRP